MKFINILSPIYYRNVCNIYRFVKKFKLSFSYFRYYDLGKDIKQIN